jgi:hypothetical protein
MARQLRVEYARAIYHVKSRGDRQEAIFWDDEDRDAGPSTSQFYQEPV